MRGLKTGPNIILVGSFCQLSNFNAYCTNVTSHVDFLISELKLAKIDIVSKDRRKIICII